MIPVGSDVAVLINLHYWYGNNMASALISLHHWYGGNVMIWQVFQSVFTTAR